MWLPEGKTKSKVLRQKCHGHVQEQQGSECNILKLKEITNLKQLKWWGLGQGYNNEIRQRGQKRR